MNRQRAKSFDSLHWLSYWIYQNRCCFHDIIPEEYLKKYAFLQGGYNHWMDMMLEIQYQSTLEQFEKEVPNQDEFLKNVETFGQPFVTKNLKTKRQFKKC
jgi:hypothetical protein